MVRLIMVGDTGSGNKDQHRVAKAIREEIREHRDVEAVCIVGDNIYKKGVTSIDDPQFQSKFEDPYRDIDVPFYLCLGNHDYGNYWINDERYKHQIAYTSVSPKWNMPARYYMKDFAPCDLFFIDTNLDHMEPEEISRQIRDVKKMFLKSRNPWKILCGHHTWRSTGGHGNADDKLEDLLQKLFRTCPFDMYVCGHDHCKNHSEVTLPNGHRTQAIVIGTGGQRYDDGPIYEEHIAEAGDTILRKALTTLGFMNLHATPRKLRFSFHDENGHEEHAATLLKEKRANTKKTKGKTKDTKNKKKRMGISRRKRKSRKGRTKSPFR